MNPVHHFQDAMIAAGLEPPESLEADGKIHRFPGRSGASWYLLHLNGVPAGCFGNWRSGISETWCSKSKSEMSDIERQATWERVKAARQQRDIEQARSHAEAATRAAAIWASAVPAMAHDYLNHKAIKGHGVRTDGHYLLVPMRCTAGKLHSLQTIAPDGSKRFMQGGLVAACYFAIGKPDGLLVLCEGLATGATLHEQTGGAVAVCFSASNLMPVALALRAKYPAMSMTIAADDDWKTHGNPGLTAARAAASAVDARLAIPDFTGLQRGIKDTDFQDMARCIREQREAS